MWMGAELFLFQIIQFFSSLEETHINQIYRNSKKLEKIVFCILENDKSGLNKLNFKKLKRLPIFEKIDLRFVKENFLFSPLLNFNYWFFNSSTTVEKIVIFPDFHFLKKNRGLEWQKKFKSKTN